MGWYRFTWIVGKPMKIEGPYYDVAACHRKKGMYVANWSHTFLKDAVADLYRQVVEKERKGIR